MSEQIRPALSAEEWAQVSEADVEHRRTRGPLNHADAALALYGQPFGFTREELKALQWNEPRGTSDMDHAYHSAMEKIAALLPPE